jgi:Tfp pilus assembly protein PilX
MNIHYLVNLAECRRIAPGRHDKSSRHGERGVALVITLLILSMITALSLGMVIAFSSETLIGGYYRNFRGAFYAADSGVNIARQQIMTQIIPSVPSTFTIPATGPTATACGTISSVNVASTYAALTSLNTGTASQSWNEKFKITNAQVFTPVATPGLNSYSCSVGYAITSIGTAAGSEQQTVTETGNIIFTVTGASATNNVSFSYFGAFVDNYPPGIGPLVPGTMTGPMFTNQAWEFMANQPPWTSPYIFTDPVGQVLGQADFWDTGWGQHWVAGSSYGSGANLIAPTFEAGFNLNQTAVPLPTNSFNQEEAVVDGKGNNSGWTPTGSGGLTTLTNVSNSGIAWASGTTSGIFANQGTNSTACGSTPMPCIAGGGFLVEGAADVQLVPSGSTAQIYKITQGGVTTTISIDPAANTTVISNGSTSATLNGVPENTVTATPQAQTMLYVDGTATIHGPGEGQGAIQDNAMISIVANGDIIATGDVLYKTEPVTVPQDTLIPAVANMNQVLGLYTANGNFITADSQADQNIEVDGTIATIAQSESASCNGQGASCPTATSTHLTMWAEWPKAAFTPPTSTPKTHGSIAASPRVRILLRRGFPPLKLPPAARCLRKPVLL